MGLAVVCHSPRLTSASPHGASDHRSLVRWSSVHLDSGVHQPSSFHCDSYCSAWRMVVRHEGRLCPPPPRTVLLAASSVRSCGHDGHEFVGAPKINRHEGWQAGAMSSVPAWPMKEEEVLTRSDHTVMGIAAQPADGEYDRHKMH